MKIAQFSTGTTWTEVGGRWKSFLFSSHAFFSALTPFISTVATTRITSWTWGKVCAVILIFRWPEWRGSLKSNLGHCHPPPNFPPRLSSSYTCNLLVEPELFKSRRIHLLYMFSRICSSDLNNWWRCLFKIIARLEKVKPHECYSLFGPSNVNYSGTLVQCQPRVKIWIPSLFSHNFDNVEWRGQVILFSCQKAASRKLSRRYAIT